VSISREIANNSTALGEQRLVARDHWLFRAQGGGHDVKRVGCPAYQLDDDVHRRIRDERVPVGRENFRRDLADGGADLGQIADEDLGNVQGHTTPSASGDQFAVTLKGVPDSGTDGSESGQADAKGCAGVHAADCGGVFPALQVGSAEKISASARSLCLTFRFEPIAMGIAWQALFHPAAVVQIRGARDGI